MQQACPYEGLRAEGSLGLHRRGQGYPGTLERWGRPVKGWESASGGAGPRPIPRGWYFGRLVRGPVQGMRTMVEDGIRKALRGLTTLEEVAREAVD